MSDKKDVIEVLNEMMEKMKPPKLKGFVLLPDIDGYKIYEFDSEELRTLITLKFSPNPLDLKIEL